MESILKDWSKFGKRKGDSRRSHGTTEKKCTKKHDARAKLLLF